MIEGLKAFIQGIDPNCDLIGLSTYKQIIDELNFVQGDHPKLFANYIGNLLQITQNHIIQLNNQQKYELIDIIVATVELYPSTLKKNSNRIERIFDIICRIMANISQIISPNWYKPPPDCSQQNPEKLQQYDPQSALVFKFRTFIDRIGNSVGYSKMIEIIQQKALTYYKDGDWRWKSAILMCFSQLSENVQLSKIEKVMFMIKQGVVDPHPKVRFSAIQALGQLSDDLKPDFQEKYFHQIMPYILNGFKDEVQRVAAHWMACMTNFIEDFTNTLLIMPYVPQIMNYICKFLEGESAAAKQNSISALSSLVTVPSLFDKNTIQKPFEICHSVIQSHSIQNYKQLINQVFQCLTIAISSQPYQLVKDYIVFVIQIMNQIAQKLDPDYLLAGWHRLCNIQQKFNNWIPMFSRILEIVKKLQLSQIKFGLDSIIATVSCFNQDFYPFSIETLQFLQQLFEKALQQQQSQAAIGSINAIQQIINKAKPANPDPNWNIQVKLSINNYTVVVEKIIDKDLLDLVEKILNSLKQMLSNYGFLYTENQTMQLFNYFWNISDKLHTRKLMIINNQIANISVNDQQQVDEDFVKQKIQSDQKLLNSCKLQIPDIIQTLSKNIKNPASIIPVILQKTSAIISSASDNEDLRYGTYYIDNMLQDYDYELLKNYWESFYKYLSEFSVKSDAPLRNSATFGIGVLIQKTPNQLVSMNTINTWVEVVKNAYSVPKNANQTQKVYGHCQDNCVAVVGKILKRFSKVLNLQFLHQKWLQVLPLKYDHDQNRIQIRYLCYLLNNQPQTLIKGDNLQQSKKTLKTILKIYSDLVINLRKKKISKQNEKILKQSKETLAKLVQWPIFKENQPQLTSQLNQNQKFQLKELMTNDLFFDH